MNTFTTGYLLSVMFGTGMLIAFSVDRFNQHAVELPADIVRLKLTPKLLTQPERYRVGLAFYLGVTLGVFFLATLFPEALLTLVTSNAGSAGEAMVGSDWSPADGIRSAAFPLAVAAVLTSAQFLKFAAEPERLLRKMAQRLAGVPEDVGYVIDLVRSSDLLNSAQLLAAAQRLHVGSIVEDWSWQSYDCDVTEGTQSPSEAAPSPPPCPRWQMHAARAIQYADQLLAVHAAREGVYRHQQKRVEYWRRFDFALFDNFWRLADERISRLRKALAQIPVDAQTRNNVASAAGDPNGKAAPDTGAAALLGMEQDERQEGELEAIQLELSALLAAGVSTGGGADFRDLSETLEVFKNTSPQLRRVDARQRVFEIRGFGVEIRSSVAKAIFVVGVLVSLVGVVAFLPSLREGITTLNEETLAEEWTALSAKDRDDKAKDEIPFLARQAGPFNWDSLQFLLAVAAILGGCCIGFRAAFKRRNEIVARSLEPGMGPKERLQVTEGDASAVSTPATNIDIEDARTLPFRLLFEPSRKVMTIGRHLQLLRIALIGGLFTSVVLLSVVSRFDAPMIT